MDDADKAIVLAVLEQEYPATLTLDDETLDAAIEGHYTGKTSDDSEARIDLHGYAMLVKDIATIVTALVALVKAGKDAYALIQPAGDKAKALTDQYLGENRLPARIDLPSLYKMAEVVVRRVFGQ